ncbi:MAG: molybdopterin-guanine dinucleotide biosynthesis protein B [Candidatus Sifarchaeia archaeon]|jgi:molybdopterin-guanine dinucleotide biosynthesis protein B
MFTYIICVVGPKRNVGKTTVVEGLVKNLTEKGLRIGTVKHIHGTTFDTPEKDTWKHIKAGATATGVITDSELLTIWNSSELPIIPETVLDKLPKNFDYVIIEGFRHSSFPKIIVADAAEDLESINLENLVAISGRVVEKPEELKKLDLDVPVVKINEIEKLVNLLESRAQTIFVNQLPGIDCKSCGYNTCEELAKAVRAGEADVRQCITMFTKVDLSIDGKTIVMKGFVQDLFKAVVMGVIKELKEVPEKIRELDLQIRLE